MRDIEEQARLFNSGAESILKSIEALIGYSKEEGSTYMTLDELSKFVLASREILSGLPKIQESDPTP